MPRLREEQFTSLKAYWTKVSYVATAATSSTVIAEATLHPDSITKISGGNATSTPPVRGIVTDGYANLVKLRSANDGYAVTDGYDDAVFGRLTHAGSDYTVSYVKLSEGIEVSVSLGGAGSIDIEMLLPEVMELDEATGNAYIIDEAGFVSDGQAGGGGGGSLAETLVIGNTTGGTNLQVSTDDQVVFETNAEVFRGSFLMMATTSGSGADNYDLGIGAGDGVSSEDAGSININGGGSVDGYGGAASLNGGIASGNGTGGDSVLLGGQGLIGGNVTITGGKGFGTANTAGSVNISTGPINADIGSKTGGNITLNIDGTNATAIGTIQFQEDSISYTEWTGETPYYSWPGFVSTPESPGLGLEVANATSGNIPGRLSMKGGDAFATSGDNGGKLDFRGGNGDGAGAGGDMEFDAGFGGVSGNGGTINIQAGYSSNAGGTSASGAVLDLGGGLHNSGTPIGGKATLFGGNVTGANATSGGILFSIYSGLGTGSGGNFDFIGGNSGATSGNGSGFNVTLGSGGGGSATGGSFNLIAGDGAASGVGGGFAFTAGNSFNSTSGGSFTFTAGENTIGNGGAFTVNAGIGGDTASGGSVVLNAGASFNGANATSGGITLQTGNLLSTDGSVGSITLKAGSISSVAGSARNAGNISLDLNNINADGYGYVAFKENSVTKTRWTHSNQRYNTPAFEGMFGSGYDSGQDILIVGGDGGSSGGDGGAAYMVGGQAGDGGLGGDVIIFGGYGSDESEGGNAIFYGSDGTGTGGDSSIFGGDSIGGNSGAAMVIAGSSDTAGGSVYLDGGTVNTTGNETAGSVNISTGVLNNATGTKTAGIINLNINNTNATNVGRISITENSTTEFVKIYAEDPAYGINSIRVGIDGVGAGSGSEGAIIGATGGSTNGRGGDFYVLAGAGSGTGGGGDLWLYGGISGGLYENFGYIVLNGGTTTSGGSAEIYSGDHATLSITGSTATLTSANATTSGGFTFTGGNNSVANATGLGGDVSITAGHAIGAGTGARTGGNISLTAGNATNGNTVCTGGDIILKSGDAGIGAPSTIAGSIILELQQTGSPTTEGVINFRKNSSSFIKFAPSSLEFASVYQTPTIFQSTRDSGDITGEVFTIHAQDITNPGSSNVGGEMYIRAGNASNATVSTGGKLTLSSGIGDDGYGDVVIYRGSDAVFNATASSTEFGESASGVGLEVTSTDLELSVDVLWPFSHVNPIIKQGIDPTSGVTGDTFSIYAQSTTGTSSIGGDLDLRPGSGASDDGYGYLRDSAGTDMVRWGTNRLSFFNTAPAAQQADIGVLTDSTGGTADNTVAAVSGSGADATINDNFADLIDQINQLRTTLRNLGLMA